MIYICLIILSIAVLILYKVVDVMMDYIKTLQIAVSALLNKSKLDKKIKDSGNNE